MEITVICTTSKTATPIKEHNQGEDSLHCFYNVKFKGEKRMRKCHQKNYKSNLILCNKE